ERSIALPSLDSERPVDGGAIGPLVDEVFEGRRAHLDQVLLDEFGALARAVLPVLDRAFPLEHRPAVVTVDGETREDGAEVDVAVAEGAEAPGAVGPVREARIDALLRRRPEFGVLDVKRLDPLVIDVDEADVVERLQPEVRRVVVDAAAFVALELV